MNRIFSRSKTCLNGAILHFTHRPSPLPLSPDTFQLRFRFRTNLILTDIICISGALLLISTPSIEPIMILNPTHTYLENFTRFIGIQTNSASHTEKLVSALGGFLSISAVILISRYFLPPGDEKFMVASMGASAVLLFVVPTSPFTQPWPLLGGHLIPAAIGVSCAMMISDLLIASAVTVWATIIAMYYLRCINPPGAATALAAVLSGPSTHELGYRFLLAPVGINVVVILCMAILINYLLSRWFPGRCYPASLKRK